MEASTDLLDPMKPTNLMKNKERRRRKIRAKIDHGQKRPETPPTPPPVRPSESTEIKLKGICYSPLIIIFYLNYD